MVTHCIRHTKFFMNVICFLEEIFQTISRSVDRGGWWSVTTEAVAQVMVDNSLTRVGAGAEILEQRDIVTRSIERQQ